MTMSSHFDSASSSSHTVFSASPADDEKDLIHAPFFLAGIAVMLTLGAAWGAYLLLKIGFNASFTSVGIHEVNAHGHAQIFGWVGLFVMGFLYHAYPRMKRTHLVAPHIAYLTLPLMLIGLLGRSIFEPLGQTMYWLWYAAIAASVLEIVAAGLFVWILVKIWKRSMQPLEGSDAFILCAAGWFFVQTIYEAGLFIALISAGTYDALLHVIAFWQAPLREIQIHGFAMLMIFGVSQWLLPRIFSMNRTSSAKSLVVLAILNLSLLGVVFGFWLMRAASPRWAIVWYASVLGLLIGSALLVWGWGLWSCASRNETVRNEPTLKFIQAAYVWLFISSGMLALLPFYHLGVLAWLVPESEAATMGFSHAYYGAIRHAITVGFVSMMIIGVSTKMAPIFSGAAPIASSLWTPFLLLNGGCALRVVGQTVTDFHQASFPITALSGLLEVAGIAAWAWLLVPVLWRNDGFMMGKAMVE